MAYQSIRYSSGYPVWLISLYGTAVDIQYERYSSGYPVGNNGMDRALSVYTVQQWISSIKKDMGRAL
ncbi:hypothetical protein DPMN_077367 [Dreissena polymorpha]|uniref:Uncharacterized protein n=1 Tax=Dreissena polymorpha TaxID=45954 RepID=A0A9D3YKC8_DREPO|nr:hypothetical protein DPMN_077367 [Dreissena polymorpha]